MTGSEGTQLQRSSPSLCAEQNAAFQFTAQSLQPYLSASLTLLVCPSFNFFCFFFKSMKANFKASSKQNHLIHYRSEYPPLQNPLWDISVLTMPTMNNSFVTSLRNIEPKFVVKLQHFGTERDIFPPYILVVCI